MTNEVSLNTALLLPMPSGNTALTWVSLLYHKIDASLRSIAQMSKSHETAANGINRNPQVYHLDIRERSGKIMRVPFVTLTAFSLTISGVNTYHVTDWPRSQPSSEIMGITLQCVIEIVCKYTLFSRRK